MAALRVALGTATLLVYLSNWDVRYELYGRHGYLDGALSSFSISGPYRWWATTQPRTTAMYVFGLVVALLFTIFGGRCLTALHAACYGSLVLSNVLVAHAGDKVTRNVLILLVLTETGCYFRPRFRRPETRAPSGRLGSISGRVHNAGVVLIAIQLATVYFWTAFYKLSGTAWQNGLALWQVSHVRTYSLVPLDALLFGSPILATLAAYGIIITQLMVAYAAVRAPAWRLYALVAVFLFHVGIAVFMGLIDFAFMMIAIDLALLSDAEFEVVSRWIRLVRFRSRFGLQLAPSSAVTLGFTGRDD